MHSTRAATGRFVAFLDWLTWQRIVLIASAGAVFVGIVVYVLLPRQYSAATSILTSQAPSPVAGLQGLSMSGMSLNNAAIERMEYVLKSRRVRDALVEKYELESRLELSHEKALEWLDAASTINIVGGGGLLGGIGLTIQVTSPGPSRLQMWTGTTGPFTTDEAKQVCAQWANDYVAILDEYLTTANVKSARDTRLFIEERLTEVQAGIGETEDRLQELQTQYLLMEPDSKAKELIGAAQDATMEHARTVRQAQEVAKSLSTSRSRLQREDAERISQEITQRNPVIVSLEQRLAGLREDLATQMGDGKSSQHPDVVAVQSGISDVERQLELVTRDVLQQVTRQPNPLHDSLLQDVTRLEVQLAGTHARQEKLSQQMDEADNALRELPPVVREYVHMNRKRQIQTETLTALARQLETANIEEQRESSDSFQVLDEAVPPERKSGPSTVKNAALTFLAIAFLLGFGWAYRHGMFTEYEGNEA